MKVASILQAKGTRLVTMRPSQTIAAVVRRLRSEGIGAIILSEDGQRMLGMISEREIVHSLAVHGTELLDLPASELMLRSVVTCGPDDSVRAVMAAMTRHRVRHIPVMEDGRLRGIVSIGDVVKHRLDEVESETRVLRDAYIAGHR